MKGLSFEDFLRYETLSMPVTQENNRLKIELECQRLLYTALLTQVDLAVALRDQAKTMGLKRMDKVSFTELINLTNMSSGYTNLAIHNLRQQDQLKLAPIPQQPAVDGVVVAGDPDGPTN